MTPSGGVATSFTYDADGQRMKSVRPDGTTLYTPFATYERQVGGGATIHRKQYLFGGEVIAVRVAGDPVSANNGLFYRYSDHLGSTSVLGKAGASSPQSDSAARYFPFGDWRSEPAQTITSLGYTGHRHNNQAATNDLGLIYMNARYYLPGLGRFASPDTLVPDPTNPQAFNRYTYVLNNPLAFTDPSGHCTEAYSGASRADNLSGTDSGCWEIYYRWLDKGYTGLDPSWEYRRDDIWLIEELYLQHGVYFRQSWNYHWAIDGRNSQTDNIGRECAGPDCLAGYQVLTIHTGSWFLALRMNDELAFIFHWGDSVLGGDGRTRTSYSYWIGSDSDHLIRDRFEGYARTYEELAGARRNRRIGLIAAVLGVPGTVFTGGTWPVVAAGLMGAGAANAALQLDVAEAYSRSEAAHYSIYGALRVQGAPVFQVFEWQ